MFAYSPWKEIVMRALVVTMILFNTTTPTVARAKSVQSDITGEQETKTKSSLENNSTIFERPSSQLGERSDQANIVPPESSDVRLRCIPANSSTFPEGNPTCTDTNPNISVTETFQTNAGINWFTGGSIRFKIECTGSNCAPPDIYYLAILDGEFATTSTFGSCIGSPPCDWGADVHSYIHFAADATWGMPNGNCGTTAIPVLEIF
jgi:hypothetical protein